MTIYAIVNDLIGENNPEVPDEPMFSIISSSAILQGGNPYFVPYFADSFEARGAIAMRIGRLGKGIARRFAHRYVDAVAPALLFIAPGLLESLKERGLPWTKAISYDKCLALGKFTSVTFSEIPLCNIGLKLMGQGDDGLTEYFRTFSNLETDAIIEGLSRDNTLKTGDILLASIASEGPVAIPGHSATLYLNGEQALRFNIR